MKLVVGLGNPGLDYAFSRHNIGYWVVEEFARRMGWTDDFPRDAKHKFDGEALGGMVGNQRVLVLEPTTYMNLSGRSVQAAMAFYQLAPQDVMVVLDDLALPCGKLRIRPGGSDGGHNGLRDIARALGTSDYPRLRVGIDPPPPRVPGKDYVLGKFTEEQRKLLEPAIARATGAIATWIDEGITTAMNRFNADVG
ncbi:MAG: aminoacyl-tRNA hydrolase [Tepidisphaeraceae bacterium]